MMGDGAAVRTFASREIVEGNSIMMGAKQNTKILSSQEVPEEGVDSVRMWFEGMAMEYHRCREIFSVGKAKGHISHAKQPAGQN